LLKNKFINWSAGHSRGNRERRHTCNVSKNVLVLNVSVSASDPKSNVLVSDRNISFTSLFLQPNLNRSLVMFVFS